MRRSTVPGPQPVLSPDDAEVLAVMNLLSPIARSRDEGVGSTELRRQKQVLYDRGYLPADVSAWLVKVNAVGGTRLQEFKDNIKEKVPAARVRKVEIEKSRTETGGAVTDSMTIYT